MLHALIITFMDNLSSLGNQLWHNTWTVVRITPPLPTPVSKLCIYFLSLSHADSVLQYVNELVHASYTGCAGGWNSRRCINSPSATAGEVTCPCVFVAFCNTTVIKSTAFIFEKLWWKGKKITLNPIWSIHILRCYCPYTAWQGLELMRMDYYT